MLEYMTPRFYVLYRQDNLEEVVTEIHLPGTAQKRSAVPKYNTLPNIGEMSNPDQE